MAPRSAPARLRVPAGPRPPSPRRAAAAPRRCPPRRTPRPPRRRPGRPAAPRRRSAGRHAPAPRRRRRRRPRPRASEPTTSSASAAAASGPGPPPRRARPAAPSRAGQRGDDRAVDRPARSGVRLAYADEPTSGCVKTTRSAVVRTRPADSVSGRVPGSRRRASAPPRTTRRSPAAASTSASRVVASPRPPSRAGRTPPRAPPARGGARPRSPPATRSPTRRPSGRARRWRAGFRRSPGGPTPPGRAQPGRRRPTAAGRRCPPGQAGDRQDREVGGPQRARLALAKGGHHEDRVGDEPAGGEHQGLRRGPVEVVRVVEEDGQRLALGAAGHHPERGRAHREPVRRRPGVEGQRGPQRRGLRGGQLVQVAQRAPCERERAERQVALGLRTGDPDDVHPSARLAT